MAVRTQRQKNHPSPTETKTNLTVEDKIDLKEELFDSLYKQYQEKEQQVYFKGCIVGPPKSGKTSSIVTAPRPILVLNFDPVGLSTIDSYLRSPNERIYVHDFSGDTAWHAEGYQKFATLFDEYDCNNTFAKFNTVFLDSQTSFFESMMSYIVNDEVGKGRPRVNKIQPAKQDFQQQKLLTLNFLIRMLKLPCHFVLFGHENIMFDENNKAYFSVSMGAYGGQALPTNLPTKFTEYYYTQVTEIAQDTFDFSWITAKSPERQFAGSGLADFDPKTGKRTNLPCKVPQNFKQLFKNLGLSYQDK